MVILNRFSIQFAWVILLGFCLHAFVAPTNADTGASLFGPREELTIKTKLGEFKFQVEIADTNQKRSQGLMFREQMAPTHGMLFDFQSLGPVSMWMANTILPLDMVFIKDGLVKRIEQNTTPYSRQIITSGEPVSHVLELNAGTSLQIGLKAGDRIVHRFFETQN